MFLRQIAGAFDPIYLKPKILAGALTHLLPQTVAVTLLHGSASRSGQERRHADRRRHSQKVLLELRTPYSRRNRSGRRSQDAYAGAANCGIDLYA